MKETRQKIFVVEDDEGIQEVYLGALEDLYNVSIFGDGNSFFETIKTKKPDLVILDLMLPDMGGYEILTKIRETDERLPVLIVSAKSDEVSFIRGLNKGADDYITKPFSILELLARIKTNFRRASFYVTIQDGYKIDNKTYRAFFNGEDLCLTLKEFNLFKLLIAKAGITVARDEIFDTVWGENYFGETRTLDIHIAQLRDKIKKIGGENCIVTVRGVGYRYETEVAEEE